jgi:hypothetical protein
LIKGSTTSNHPSVSFDSVTDIRFSTDGNNYIGNWKISPDRINIENKFGTLGLSSYGLSITGKSETISGIGSILLKPNHFSMGPEIGEREGKYNLSFSTPSGLEILYNGESVLSQITEYTYLNNLNCALVKTDAIETPSLNWYYYDSPYSKFSTSFYLGGVSSGGVTTRCVCLKSENLFINGSETTSNWKGVLYLADDGLYYEDKKGFHRVAFK